MLLQLSGSCYFKIVLQISESQEPKSRDLYRAPGIPSFQLEDLLAVLACEFGVLYKYVYIFFFFSGYICIHMASYGPPKISSVLGCLMTDLASSICQHGPTSRQTIQPSVFTDGSIGLPRFQSRTISQLLMGPKPGNRRSFT